MSATQSGPSRAPGHLPRVGPANETVASEIRSSRVQLISRRWKRATWFAVVTYCLGSPSLIPVLHILPAGSTSRGLCLTAIPLIGAVALGPRIEPERSRAVDKTVVLLVLVLALQAVSAVANLGLSYLVHAAPAVALLILGMAARANIRDLPSVQIRTCLRGPIGPLIALLLLSWCAQLTHLVPSIYPSSFVISISGSRLQGLAIHPDGFGLLAALVAVLSFCAASSRLIWVARAISFLSILGTDSRTAFLAMAAGVLLFWVFGPEWPLSRRVSAILSAIFATPLAWIYIDIHRATGSGQGDILTGRALIWADASHLVHQVGLLGDGPETIARLFPALLGAYTHIYQAQNQWINDAVNFGYLESALLAVLLLSFLVTGERTYRHTLLIPLVGFILIESFSEIPIDFWASTVEAFPFFLLLLLCPRRCDPRPLDSLPRVTLEPVHTEVSRIVI